MAEPYIHKIVEIPQGVTVDIKPDGTIIVKGPKGQVTRRLAHPGISIVKNGSEVVVGTDSTRRKVGALVGTYASHIRNGCKGTSQGFHAQLKVVYNHFPIKTKVQGDTFLIENFLGERSPRKASIRAGVKVQAKGVDVSVEGADIESVGQTAANIESATKVRKRDVRVFQDGIYITSKPGAE